MSDQIAQPIFLADAQPLAVIDDAAVSRAQDILTTNGVKIDPGILEQALTAAVMPSPSPDEIPVSLGMAAAGRQAWINNPSGSPNVLLPAIYRAMEQKRQDEDAAVAAAQATLVLAQ